MVEMMRRSPIKHDVVWKEGWEEQLDDSDREPQHQQDDGAKNHLEDAEKDTAAVNPITQHAPVLVVIIKGTRGGGETTDHRENEPPQVSVNGKVNHLLNGVEVWIIQVPQEPQNPRSEHLQHTKTSLSPFFNPFRTI